MADAPRPPTATPPNPLTLPRVPPTRIGTIKPPPIPAPWRAFTTIGDVPLSRPVSHWARTRALARCSSRSTAFALPLCLGGTAQPARGVVRPRQCSHQRMALSPHYACSVGRTFARAQSECPAVSLSPLSVGDGDGDREEASSQADACSLSQSSRRRPHLARSPDIYPRLLIRGLHIPRPPGRTGRILFHSPTRPVTLQSGNAGIARCGRR